MIIIHTWEDNCRTRLLDAVIRARLHVRCTFGITDMSRIYMRANRTSSNEFETEGEPLDPRKPRAKSERDAGGDRRERQVEL